MNNAFVEEVIGMLNALVEACGAEDVDQTSFLNSEGDLFQDELSDSVTDIILDLEETLSQAFVDDGELDQMAVTTAASEGYTVRQVTEKSEYYDTYDFVVCMPVGKLYFN